MSFKKEIKVNIDNETKEGEKIVEAGEKHLENAKTSREAMDRIKGADDDTQKAKEDAHAKAREIGKNIADNEIKKPADEVSDKLQESADLAEEKQNEELIDAKQAKEMVGSYHAVGDSLAAKMKESAGKFEQLAKEAEQGKAELQDKVNRQNRKMTETWE